VTLTNRGTVWPVVVLGVGLGGFVDGIVLHQILNWHHLLSAVDASHRANMLADGLFHAGTWLLTVVGLVWLWAYVRRGRVDLRWSTFAGGLLGGWGLFDVVEGLVDHQILGIHHVRLGPHQLAYDLGFLAFGLLLMTAGWLLGRRHA
jgi:uncharacterized membrane protein